MTLREYAAFAPESTERDDKGLTYDVIPPWNKMQAQRKYERSRYIETVAAWQEAVKRSEGARGRILKGLRDGEPDEVLLPDAIRCIAVITGDRGFLKRAEELIRKRGTP